jgi:hypothetical protein
MQILFTRENALSACIYEVHHQRKKITDTNQPNGKTSSRPAIQSIASTPTHHHRGDDMQAITPNTNPKRVST